MLNYCNKLILAPMVRQNKLPMRILALRYGADLIYSEELVDVTMLMCKRKINDVLGTVDYIDEIEGNVKFRTCPSEKDRLVFQIGTSCPDRAVALAKMVQNDVSGIDVNMGCPAKTSTGFGMGAALLKTSDVAKKILENLVKHISLPITCKIRIFYDIDESIKLAKEFESVGISAIAIHGRTQFNRHDSAVNIDAIQEIAENLRIPVIANGGSNQIECYEDILKFRDECGTTSVMIGAAAQKNVSIFRKDGLIPVQEVACEYLKLCVDYDESYVNAKYFLEKLYKANGRRIRKLDFVKNFDENFDEIDSLDGLCQLWGLGDYYREKMEIFKEKGYSSMPCATFHNLNIQSPEIYDHRLAQIKTLRHLN